MLKQEVLIIILVSFYGLGLQGAFTSVSLKPLPRSVTAVLGAKPSISAKLVFAVHDPRGEISGSLCHCAPDECKQTWKYAGQAITIPQPRLKTLCEEKYGSRNLTLTINPVKLSDQGQYTCGLFIPISIFLEDARITLNVNQLPNISIKRIKKQAKEATLTKVATCYANLSKPPPEMWFEDSNGKKINSENEVETKDCGNGLTNSTLYLTKRFTRSDNDLNYFCKVKHVNHTVYTRDLGSVEVLYPPTVTLEDESLSSAEVNIIKAGERFSAKCLATGNPPPDVVWTFTPDPMPNDPKSKKPASTNDGSLPSNFILEDKVKITANALASTNNGTFKCQASNQIGSPASVSFKLGVFVKSTATTPAPTTPNYPPTVTLEDESLSSAEVNIIEAGEQFSAKCLATGNPPPDVVWTFTPDPMPNDPKSKKPAPPNDGSLPKNFIILQDQVTIATDALDTTNNGSFECRAYNKVGSPATVSFKLGVFEIPSTLPSAAPGAAKITMTEKATGLSTLTVAAVIAFIIIFIVLFVRMKGKRICEIKWSKKVEQGQNHFDESVTSDGSWPLDDASEITVLTQHTELDTVETIF
ncbi:neural cell adhesion molecule 1-like [Clavelina lepadiformis]|uniref:neural cell adhesion molecule 1-like n=1 Tax=Clavelina lepadiformis TaxID=159417 RepID=UPI004042916B